jgi:hypothetical protein
VTPPDPPDPLDPEALFARARRGEADAVMTELRARVTVATEDFDAWLTLGMVAIEAGHVDRARVALAHAVDLSPHSVLARALYAKVLAPRRAREQLEAAIALAPDREGLRLELAQVIERIDPLSDAEGRASSRLARLIALVDAKPIHDRPGERVFRGDDALLHEARDPEGAITTLFFSSTASADVRAAMSIRFLMEALALDPTDAGALLVRLGEEGTVEIAGARVIFATRDIPTLGPFPGLLITRASS